MDEVQTNCCNAHTHICFLHLLLMLQRTSRPPEGSSTAVASGGRNHRISDEGLGLLLLLLPLRMMMAVVVVTMWTAMMMGR